MDGNALVPFRSVYAEKMFPELIASGEVHNSYTSLYETLTNPIC